MALTPTVELGLGGSFFGQVRSEEGWRYWQMRRMLENGQPDWVASEYSQANTTTSTYSNTSSEPILYESVSGSPFYHGEILKLTGVAASSRDLAGSIPGGSRALRLNGTSDYLRVGDNYFLSGWPQISAASVEVVLTIHSTPGVGVEPAIYGDSSSWALTYKNDGKVHLYFNGVDVASVTAPTGTLLHVVATRLQGSPNDTVVLYVNGTSASATPATASVTAIQPYYGKHWTNAHYLSATYEVIAHYPRALSADRVSAHYAALAWTDVTNDTRGAIPLVIERGIRGDNPAQRVASTGTCTFALNNLASNSGGVTGYYSPGHASCRTGFAKGIPVRVSDANDEVLFLGRIRKIAPTPGKTNGVYTSVVATDYMDQAATFLLEGAPVLESVRADQVFSAVLAKMPNPPNGVTFYQGSETYTLAMDNTRDEAVAALQEMQRLALSELGYIYQSRTGRMIHESRTSRRANHDTAQVTLSDTMHGLDVAEVASTSINRVQVTVHPRVIDSAATTVLFTLANPLEIAAGETKTIIGPYRTDSAPGITTRVGGLDMVTPVSTTDYTMNDASDGSGTDRTASLTVVANFGPNGVQFVLTNTHTGRAYITKLQCRGKGVYDFRTVVLRAQNDDAIAEDGVNALTIDMPYQEDPNVGQALADDLLTAYGDLSGTRAQTVSMLLGDPGLPADLHLYDISDRVAVAETITGATGEYYINGVRLECQSGRLPTLKWWLTPAEFPVALTAVAYNSSNFAATGGGSITVDSGDQITYAYQVRDKVMDLFVWLDTMDVTGTVTGITVAIPGGYVANRTMGLFGFITDAGTVRDANCRVAAGGTVVTISRADGSNFTATASDNTAVRINARFEVQ